MENKTGHVNKRHGHEETASASRAPDHQRQLATRPALDIRIQNHPQKGTVHFQVQQLDPYCHRN